MMWVLLMRLLKFHVFASVLTCVPAHLFMFVHCVLGEILCGCFLMLDILLSLVMRWYVGNMGEYGWLYGQF
nr:MAG: hypothetical protein [Apis mellifera filamentous virus]